MNKENKAISVQKIKSIASENTSIILLHYRGLNDSELFKIRKTLKESQCGIYIPKNSLAKIAFEQLGLPHLTTSLKGPVAITYSKDIIISSKIITGFMSEYSCLKFVDASLENKSIDFEFVKNMSSLGSESEVKARFVGILNAPASKLLSVFAAKQKSEENNS